MKKAWFFLEELYENVKKNELLYFANSLTYKLVLSVFPFVIFLMTLIGFFNISNEVELLGQHMPKEIKEIFNVFLDEVIYNRNTSLLSYSLVFTVFGASSGILHIVKGLNKAFGEEDNRGFIKMRVISMFLVIVFSVIILGSLLLVVFWNTIVKILFNFGIFPQLFGFSRYLLNMVIVFFMILIIYKVSIVKRLRIRQLIPGAVFTLFGWSIMDVLFSIYVNNFSKYSMIYGSIGSVFLLLLWINIIVFILLLGGQINAMLLKK